MWGMQSDTALVPSGSEGLKTKVDLLIIGGSDAGVSAALRARERITLQRSGFYLPIRSRITASVGCRFTSVGKHRTGISWRIGPSLMELRFFASIGRRRST